MTDLYTALTADGCALLDGALTGTVDYDEEFFSSLRSVCEDINSLTFNRIIDFDALTQFQRDTLVRVAARFLTFRRDNAELLDSGLRSYGINGVSMGFDDKAVKRIGGVTIPGDVYSLLRQTGLCCLRI